MSWRSWAAAVLTVLSVVTGFEVYATAQPGTARADVCAGVGRRVRVGGCWNVADAVSNYAPPPAYYAPLPEDYPPPPAP
ncbi:MAG: hypothetical protein JO106_14035 [Mycobacterium sp.]|jgi:hypothetical protein|nr:hypothetical protein [Mycobacterium sp.]